MNLKSEKTTVDGIVFETTQYPAMRGLELLGRLTKVLGPTLGALASADPDAELESLGPVLAVALRDLEPEQLSKLAIAVLSGTTATITSPTGATLVTLDSVDNLNLVFSSRLMVMFKVAVHAIKVNFGDFIDGSALGAPRTPAPSVKFGYLPD